MSEIEPLDDVVLDDLEQQGQEEEAAEEEAAADEAASKACVEYVTRVAQERAPRSHEQYLQLDNHSFLLPNPILAQQRAAAAGDLELASKPVDPIALRCAGIRVTYVVWHYDPLLGGFWKQLECGGSMKGQPPCPHCYGMRVIQQQQQQQQGEGQQHPVKLMKWDKGLCGTVTSHVWSSPAQRYLTGTGVEGYMLVQQYRCKDCPGVCVCASQTGFSNCSIWVLCQLEAWTLMAVASSV